MKTALAVIVALIACLLVVDCRAQDTSRFQSVGGDYGRSVIGTFGANNTAPSSGNNSGNDSLWNWGNAPKGSLIKNGKLVDDPFATWKSFNYSEGWIGEVETDPYTGNTIYAYKIPSTGEIRYFYIDPYAGTPVYVDRGNAVSNEYGTGSEKYALPAVFR